ncbi:MAG: hypothetical protein EOP85_09110, partial [Verrucomicrobiaceae bacterium]
MSKFPRPVLFPLACAVGLVACFMTLTRAQTKSSTPAKKKIVFVAGNPSHAPGEHEHRAGCMLLAEHLNKSGLPVEAVVTT